MNILDRLIAGSLPLVPRPVISHFARRYIGGATRDEALSLVRDLNGRGYLGTIDILGENIVDSAAAAATAIEYIDLLDRITADGLDSNVSIKLTQLGLAIDPAACLEQMRRVCRRAAELDNFVRIDMEDSSVTQATLDLYRALRADFEGVGIVIQSYLRRSRSDARQLAASRANVRLCKGIYNEPRSVAWQGAEIIRRSYVELLEILLDGGCYVGIATHDERLVYEAMRLIDERGLAPEQYEFQMLLGVQEELRRIILDAGHRLRVYVPFGEHWYAYSMRRLKENPQIAGHVFRNIFET
jgi:proline dehydrogenase